MYIYIVYIYISTHAHAHAHTYNIRPGAEVLGTRVHFLRYSYIYIFYKLLIAVKKELIYV